MKSNIKIISALLALSASIQTNAQDLIYDGIVRGTELPVSARFAAMGGAGTAMGGDISSFVLNPAGLQMNSEDQIDDFSKSFYASIAGRRWATEFKYCDYSDEINPYVTADFDLGFVVSGPVSIGMAFSRNTDMSTEEFSFWTDVETTGNAASLMFCQPYTGSNIKYHNILTDAETLGIPNDEKKRTFEHKVSEMYTNGGCYLLSIPFSVTIAKNVLHAGISADFHYTQYTSNIDFEENSYDYPDWEYYTTKDKSDGFAISWKGGVVFSPIKHLVLGAAYHHKVNYKFKNVYDYNISTDGAGHMSNMTDSDKVIRRNDSMYYHLSVPSKLVLSGALLLPRYGSFCCDIEYTDYSKAQYYSKDGGKQYWNDNGQVKETYRAAANLHFGTEWMIDTKKPQLYAIFLRAGYAIYGNPYKNTGKSVERTALSAGIGFAFERVNWDFTAVYSKTDTQRYLYNFGSVSAPYDFKQSSLEVLCSVKFTFGYFEDFSFKY
jgi:hypothetical protein